MVCKKPMADSRACVGWGTGMCGSEQEGTAGATAGFRKGGSGARGGEGKQERPGDPE